MHERRILSLLPKLVQALSAAWTSRPVHALLYMVVGGEGSFFGPIIGTTIFMLIPELSQGLQMYRPLVNGVLLIVIMFLMPQGLTGQRCFRRVR